MWPKHMGRNNGSEIPKCGNRHEIWDSKSSRNLIMKYISSINKEESNC